MLPSSAIHVVQDSAEQMRVICPPNYFLGILWILASAVLFVILKLVAPREWKVPVLVAGLCLLVASVILTSHEEAVLSKTEDTLKMDQRMAFYHTRQTLPLHSIQQAAVGTNEGNTHMLFFVTSSGQDISMDIGYMPRDGYYSSALAINNFLAGSTSGGASAGVPPRPAILDWAKKGEAKLAEQTKQYEDRIAQQKPNP
jgi:hypothetical protein